MRKKMNQSHRLLATCSLAAALLLSGTSAFAQDFTTDDSVMTLTLPDKEGWEQVEDSHTWMTLSLIHIFQIRADKQYSCSAVPHVDQLMMNVRRTSDIDTTSRLLRNHQLRLVAVSYTHLLAGAEGKDRMYYAHGGKPQLGKYPPACRV